MLVCQAPRANAQTPLLSCSAIAAAAPPTAQRPNASEGKERDDSDDGPHDDVVHDAPPICFAERPISPDAAHYALSPFPRLLEIQQKSHEAKTRSTDREPPRSRATVRGGRGMKKKTAAKLPRPLCRLFSQRVRRRSRPPSRSSPWRRPSRGPSR